MNCLGNLSTPQLERIHSGKVRESFRVDNQTRMIVATDRVSSFDMVLESLIPDKGRVLNLLSAYWFEATRNLVESHFIEAIDPNISLVREAKPLRVEMIVRGFLTGGMWRRYSKGQREFSGVHVEDGLARNHKFETPILTPTTKEESDREITPEGIVAEGLVERSTYQKMADISIELFEFGQRTLQEKGLVLVDTKYEFGLIGDGLVLIDEVHTPDSSRFWFVEDYEGNPDNPAQIDKEYIRQYLLANQKGGAIPTVLPDGVIDETAARYRKVYHMITGDELREQTGGIELRVYGNLVKRGIIRDAYVAIIMGSPTDLQHCEKIKRVVESYDVFVDLRVVSAHKNGEDIPLVVADYCTSLEPGAVIAVAGLSNGLGGALAANLPIPVFSCPPFKDQLDMLVNVNSSLSMPSKVPAATVLRPESAAGVALRSLNLPRLKKQFQVEIAGVKAELRAADKEVRRRYHG